MGRQTVNTRVSAPWHLWLIGLVSLLWNGIGGYDYYQTQTANRAYLAPMTEPYGVPVEQAIAYFQSYPLWVEVCWALGVWAAVAGSVLLLLRRGWAAYAFVVALLGILGTFAWVFSHPSAGLTDTPVAIGASALVAVITALLAFYSRRMVLRGVLG